MKNRLPGTAGEDFFFLQPTVPQCSGTMEQMPLEKKVDNRLSFFWICGGKVLENFGEIEGEKGEKNGRYFGLLYRHLWSL